MRAAALALLLLSTLVLADTAAVTTVTRLQEGLIALMKSSDAGPARTDAVSRLLQETHDLDYIARVVMGRHWRELSAEQQGEFIDRFEQLSVANYTSRFQHYGGEHFEVAEEQAQSEDEHSVRSVLTTANGAQHEFVYVLHRDGEQWRIVNIVVDGVSDLALKRAEYGRLTDAGGFPALLDELAQQTERLRARATEAP
jgi:phospholipid transport system substrate-binding protein